MSTMTLEDKCPSSVGIQYATEEEQRNGSIKKEWTGLKQKCCSVVDVSGDKRKVQC